MGDINLRRLERDAARGDPDAVAKLKHARGRAGVVPGPEERSWTAPEPDYHTPNLGYPEPGAKGDYLPGGPKFDSEGQMTKAPGEDWLKSHKSHCRGCSTCEWKKHTYTAKNPKKQPRKPSMIGRIKNFFTKEGLTSPQRRIISENLNTFNEGGELNCGMCGNTKEWHIYPEGHPRAGYSRVRHVFTPGRPKPPPVEKVPGNKSELNCDMCGNTKEWHLNPDGSSRVRHVFTPDKSAKPDPNFWDK